MSASSESEDCCALCKIFGERGELDLRGVERSVLRGVDFIVCGSNSSSEERSVWLGLARATGDETSGGFGGELCSVSVVDRFAFGVKKDGGVDGTRSTILLLSES